MPHLTRLRQEVVNVMKIYMFVFSHLKMTYTFSIYNKEISAKIPGIYKKKKKKGLVLLPITQNNNYLSIDFVDLHTAWFEILNPYGLD